MQLREESLRSQIALGWAINLAIMSIMLGFMILQSILTEAESGFRSLHFDPGRSGAKWLVFVIALYALMPAYVSLVNGLRPRIFRWIAVALAAVGLVFFLLHHLSHWYFGQRPDFSSHVLDLTLHLIGLWVLVNSVRWAKLPPSAAA
jgi:hypothetical protein